MYRKPDAPQLIGGVLDNGFVLFKASLGSVVGLAGLAAAISSVSTLLSNPFASLAAVWPPSAAATAEPEALPHLPVMLLSLFIAGVFYLATVTRMAAFSQGEVLDLRTTVWRAVRRYPAALGYALALIALWLGSLVLGAGLLVPAVAAGVQPSGIVVLVILMILVTAVPVGVAFIYSYFAVFVIVMEGLGPVRAVARSFRLVRGFWWRTLAIVTVAYFIYFAIAALAGILGLVAGTVAGFTDLNVRIVTYVAEVATGAATMPFLVAVSLAIFYDLELRRGGGDLAARIDAVRA